MKKESSFFSEEAIHVRYLSKSFGTTQAVNSLDLSVNRNEILGLLGPNGAGKTTTIRMICGLLKPDTGEVFIRDRTWKDSAYLKKIIGYAPQENVFWPKLTCLEQLTFVASIYKEGSKNARSRSIQLLEMLGLEDKADALAMHLSGGMKRRLSLALSLVHDPEILILDEPEAGLDPQSRIMVREFIRKMSEKKTIILSTHNMDEADRLSDRIAIMDRGVLLMNDTPENLKKTIGKGDVLEIEIDKIQPDDFQKIESMINSIGLACRIAESLLIIQGLNLISRIPEINQALNLLNIRFNSMTHRENSLEDVFIHLTGRRLRS